MRRVSREIGSVLDPGLLRLDRVLSKHQQIIHVSGIALKLEVLDDLKDAIAKIMRECPPTKDPATGVAEICPHFGIVWPSALALSEYLVEQAQKDPSTRPRSVLELGCGLGIPSLIARKLGVSRVVASDRHELVPFFLKRNAASNKLEDIVFKHIDWRLVGDDSDPTTVKEAFDLIVGSDLLYEAWQPGHLANTLASLLSVPNASRKAWIADPGRKYFSSFLELVEARGLKCRPLPDRMIPHGKKSVAINMVEVSLD